MTNFKSQKIVFQPALNMASPKVEQLPVPITTIGEGPHWDHKTQALYYVDIKGNTVNKYDPATKKHTSIKIGMYQIHFIFLIFQK